MHPDEPEEKIKPRDYRARLSSWQSRLTPSLVVCIIGISLTLICMLILSALVSDIESETRTRQFRDVQSLFAQTLQDDQDIVGSLSAYLTAAGSGNVNAALAAFPQINRFDEVDILKPEGGVWTAHEIYHTAASLSDVPARSTVAAFVQALPSLPNGFFDVTGAGIFVTSGDDPVDSPILIAHLLQKNNPQAGIAVGIIRFSSMLPFHWLDNRPSLGAISIVDSDSGHTVYSMRRGDGTSHVSDFAQGNRHWRLSSTIGPDSSGLLLQNVPSLILIVGFLLTALTTLFFSKKRKYSLNLMRVNRTLSQRNRELNTEAAERERLNTELRDAEREYKSIIDAVSDIIFETSSEGDLLFLNATWEKLSGFAVAQTLNRSIFSLLHPQDQDELRRNFLQLVKGSRAPFRSITRIRTSAGGFRAIELGFSMLRQDENRLLRVVGTMTDVEERRRAERALVEAEKKYRTIVENAAGGIYQVTPEGQFLSVNPAMARVLGYASTEDMLRQVINVHTDLYPNRAERLRFIRELESSGQVKNFETQVKARNGALIWVNENARAVKDEENGVVYFEGSLEDITKRKEAENKLREAKVQSDLASRAKSEFLANMSHELRTPLNAIIGFSEIIRDEVLGPIQNRQYKDYISDIYESGRRLLQIINEILDVSRIETGERQLNEGIVDIGKIVASAVEFILPKAEAARLAVDNQIGLNAPRIVGEELAVKQIIINLLSNAVKFTQAGGHITLSHQIDSDGQLQISITDTGSGIAEEEIAKALSPFGQLNSSLNRGGGGAGLGLTLVDSLIRLHGGKLELFSQKGVGTTATIIFPHRRVAQAAVETLKAVS